MDQNMKRRRYKRQCCRYCCQSLSKSAYYRHLQQKGNCINRGSINFSVEQNKPEQEAIDVLGEESSICSTTVSSDDIYMPCEMELPDENATQLCENFDEFENNTSVDNTSELADMLDSEEETGSNSDSSSDVEADENYHCQSDDGNSFFVVLDTASNEEMTCTEPYEDTSNIDHQELLQRSFENSNSMSNVEDEGLVQTGYVDQIEEDVIEEWEDEEVIEAEPSEVDDVNELDNAGKAATTNDCFTQAVKALLFLMSWQYVFKVSDRALMVLVLFFKTFLGAIADICKCERLQQLANILPKTLFSIRKLVGVDRDDYVKYVVCPRCSSTYLYDDAIETTSAGRKKSKKCTYKQYPHHPSERQRRPCGTILFKQVRSKNGKTFLYPKLVFCFKSVIDSLQQMLLSPNFLKKCNTWQKRDVSPEMMSDVYDGQIWKKFQRVNGKDLLANGRTFGVMLNVDWFQPYKHSPYSVGVMYLAIQNLPRDERFRPENVILCGIIPGPKEPKLHINSFLKPLVEELHQLYEGINMKDTSFCGSNIYRMLLLSLACDVPATRKCGGFKAHNAKKGCSRCLKDFITEHFGSKPDYSGYDRNSWEQRTDQEHRMYAEMAYNAKTKTEQNNIEKTYGARYSILYELPYYDSIRFAVIDPMHNLLLGTPKQQIRVWKNLGILKDEHFEIIQNRMDKVKLPADIGRIPRKIASGFCGFSADQWRVWTCIISPFALKGVIDEQYYNCWMLYVKACNLICQRTITFEELEIADRHLLLFCKTFQQLYGSQYCTPNMHLHLHIKECILDYGPVYSFWCFSFERFNGILGAYHVNNLSIEVQLMRKFLINKFLHNLQDEHMQFHYLLPSDCRGTANEKVEGKHCTVTDYWQRVNSNELHHVYNEDCNQIVLPRILKCMMHYTRATLLEEMFSKLYTNQSSMKVMMAAHKFERVNQYGDLYAVDSCRSGRNAFIRAKWMAKDNATGRTFIEPSSAVRPGVIVDLVKCDVRLENEAGKMDNVPHIIAIVKWFKKHEACANYGFSSVVQVWSTEFETDSAAKFIPLHRIMGKCAVIRDTVGIRYGQRIVKELVNVVIPLNSKISM